jgi:hypothetical protein
MAKKTETVKADSQNPQTFGKDVNLPTIDAITNTTPPANPEVTPAEPSLTEAQVEEICKGYNVTEFWMVSDRSIMFSEEDAEQYCTGHLANLTYEHFAWTEA